MIPAAPSEPRPTDNLTIAEAAKLSRVSVREVRAWIAAGRISRVYLGNQILIPRWALEDYWRRMTVGWIELNQTPKAKHL